MTQDRDANAYLVGGGIASLAAAVFLVRDAQFPPHQIHIFEATDLLGGSLDGSGDPSSGYLIRGGRMFEEHFGCTYDLLREIPALEDSNISVSQEIKTFTADVVPSSNCRLVNLGVREEAPGFQLSLQDKWDLIRLSQRSEESLQGVTIEEYFSPHFLTTNFWIMWCTMFAFQSWHSAVEMRRYMRRFMHLLPGFNRLEGIHRTRLNQYDSIVRPIVRWLEEQGVQIHLCCPVADVDFCDTRSHITHIRFHTDASQDDIELTAHDKVLVTLGSMTEDSSVGNMCAPPPANDADVDGVGAWPLWRNIATKSPHFGHPERFVGDTARTQWLSFTVTLKDSRFFEHMDQFTHNTPGTGGLVTFRNSAWLMSVVLAHQPHFANQPDDVYVFWGYGLHPDKNGDHITKPMLACSGREILAELAFHLSAGEATGDMFASAECIPCLMPHITTQFMPRLANDRPQVIPNGAVNYAFLGQFVELPDDTVFTVEYSVRSAQTAVYGLCDQPRQPTRLYKGFAKVSVVSRALKCILQNGPGIR